MYDVEAHVSFRHATAGEADTISSIWVRANARRTATPEPTLGDAGVADRFRVRLASRDVIAVLAEDGADAIACCFATPLWDQHPSQRGADVSAVAVVPERWGEGLGTAIVTYLEDELAHAGYSFARLFVLESNDRARHLYERLGWVLVGLGAPHNEGPQAVYEKTLA